MSRATPARARVVVEEDAALDEASSHAPRFRGLRPRSSASSRVGTANRREHTIPETLLRRALWGLGLRYRLHAPDLPGCPDLVLRRRRVAVFCDGDFWHGRRWQRRKAKLAAGWNASYWIAKIERNRHRDQQVSRTLRRLGWQVIRVWEGDVRQDPTRVARLVLKQISARAR